MNHLVIDLEMCMMQNVYKTPHGSCRFEIIQVGAVLLDEDFAEIGRLSQYVYPVHGTITKRIEELTGITNQTVKNAPQIEAVLGHLIDFIGDRPYDIYAWSNSDHLQLKQEISLKGITSEKIASFMDKARWIDYQQVFDRRFEFRSATGLENALRLIEIEPDGRFHDGLDDAVNTAALIRKLEREPEYEIYDIFRKEYEQAHEVRDVLKYGLGDLFAALDLQWNQESA